MSGFAREENCALVFCKHLDIRQTCNKGLTTHSHENYSYVAVRHLRRLETGDAFLLSDVLHLLLSSLNLPGDFIEWTMRC